MAVLVAWLLALCMAHALANEDRKLVIEASDHSCVHGAFYSPPFINQANYFCM